MLSIRLQRIGRKGHPAYRVVVQDVRQAPTSGRYVALLGSYDPHAKTTTLEKEKAKFYLDNGAQPSDRVVRLFKSEKISIPKWVKDPTKQERSIRNPEKLRKNRPAEEVKVEEPKAEEVAENTEADNSEATPTEKPEAEAPVEAAEPEAEKPAEEAAPKEAAEPAEKPEDSSESEDK